LQKDIKKQMPSNGAAVPLTLLNPEQSNILFCFIFIDLGPFSQKRLDF